MKRCLPLCTEHTTKHSPLLFSQKGIPKPYGLPLPSHILSKTTDRSTMLSVPRHRSSISIKQKKRMSFLHSSKRLPRGLHVLSLRVFSFLRTRRSCLMLSLCTQKTKTGHKPALKRHLVRRASADVIVTCT
jgi:hypothetical protein